MNFIKRGIRYFAFPLLLIVIGASLSAGLIVSSAKKLNADGNWFETGNGIDQSKYVTLGGAKQFVRIRSRNHDNPILLELHGGPGSPQIPWSHRTLRPLTEYFTLIEWDQRGAGRSDSSELLTSTMTYDQMVNDTIELIEYLQAEYDTKKVILVGHSWGAMLGLGVAQKRPDLLHAYVGVGQALAWPGGFDETQRLLISAATKAGDTETANSLRALPKDWPPKEDIETFMKRVKTIQAPMERYGTSLHASKSNSLFKSNLLLDVALSPETGVLEGLKMLDVSENSKALMIDLYGRDLRNDLTNRYQVPMFIFQGEHDWQTPTSLVKPWFEKLDAPQKTYVQFDNSAHIIVNEEPGKFLFELVSRVRPLALGS
ncbi:alpha/beta hydrolase [Parasphingorhabdus sp.]|jgi:pimeloyl-ACP methyl ester carboxylesterase|uniref:alpha/beta hydrolase n=1 Tax=Parasphingorhabdus sp. TaxID=2709688 RepID=UPI003D291195